jgi:4-amino-4-deoxy-L-arabinose transferase-like glycosyltransferase
MRTANWRSDMKKHIYLAPLALAFLLVGFLYAFFTPDWQAPDEPAHYNYIRQLASGKLPVLEPGDYDQEYQSLVISSQFDEQYAIDAFEYQDYQPPLYYLIQTPVYRLFDGALRPLRLFSVLIGLGVVILTYFVVVQIFPDRRWLALMAAVFVAFLPQHTAMMAAVNNDSLAELLIAAILLVTITLLLDGREAARENQRFRLLLLGLLLGFGFLTKVSVYIMAPLVGLSLLWLNWGRWRALGRILLLVFGPAIALGLIWWLRNSLVYGDLDVVGTFTHNSIVTGQPRTGEWIADRGLADTIRAFVQTSFQSFWGQFGWMGVVMPNWVYTPLLFFTLLTITGFGWAAITFRRSIQKYGEGAGLIGVHWKAPALLLIGTFILSLLVFLSYNLTFVQHQGRYLFPALVPIGFGVALSWAALSRPLVSRWPFVVILLPLGLAAVLIALDLIALFRFIIPALT